MIDEINTEIKNAMKAKEKAKLEALRYMKSMLMENATSKAPKPELDIVISHYKKLEDSVASYPEGHEQVEKIKTELTHIKPFLPAQLSEEEVFAIIKGLVDSQDSPNMGSIMKELSPQIKGKFNGKRANEIVRELLK